MTQQLLKIRGLKIEGKSDEVWTPIVNGIDLDLQKGEVLGLIGESGAGKSRSAWRRWDLRAMAAAYLAARWISTGSI